MNRIGEKIKELRKEKNLHQKELAKKISVSVASVSFWEQGLRNPNAHQRKKLCDFFGISEPELFGTLISKEPSPVQKVPLISWVHANKFEEISPFEITHEYIYTDIKDEHLFALQVSNDCMAPEFNQGDIIIVHPAVTIQHDDYVVVADYEANTATFKQIKIYGKNKILHPLNPKYKDIELDHKKQYEIVGKVVAKQRRY